MSRHVQRQSWKLVGSAQHGSEHPNRQLLASSFLALCLIFLRVFLSASLSSDVFFLGAHVLSSRRTTTRGPLYRKCTISRVVSSIGVSDADKMLTWDVYTTSTDLCVWQCTFKFNHVWETTSPESVTAASEMRISCSINLLHLSPSFLRLCLSCLHVLRSIFVTADNLHCANNYRSDHKTVMSDSVSNTQGRKRADPVPCVHDGLPAVCTVSSGETVVCSFLSQSLRRKSCLWLKLSSPLWTIQPPDIKKHRSTKLYKSHALNNVCVCVHPHVQLCVCVFVALVLLLEAWLIF